MNRREIVGGLAGGAALAWGAAARAGQASVARPSAAASSPTLREMAEEAYIYGFAINEMALSRQAQFAKGLTPGRFEHKRALSGPETRWVTTPNNDTLYSISWLDLSKGPAQLSIPACGDRYYCVAFLDMFSNNYTLLSHRTLGGEGGDFTIVGPDDAAHGPNVLRSPTRWSWVTIRILISGPEELPVVHRLQDRFVMRGPSAPLPPVPADRYAPWPEYFASVDRLLRDNGAPVTDLGLIRRIAPLGLNGGGFDPNRFSARQADEIAAGVDDGRRKVAAKRRGGTVVNGWLYPKVGIGDFGQDYLYRAQVALGGLGVLTVDEAIYPRPLSEDGTLAFDGAVPRRLHFPAGQAPPVDAFWSLSMYELEPTGQLFFTPNPLQRYAIGDRTPGLRYGADGSLDIWISRTDPGGARTANWLPAPQEKPFSLDLRAYAPKPAMLDGSYRLPPLERV